MQDPTAADTSDHLQGANALFSPQQQYLQCHTYDIDGSLHVGVARALRELLADPHAQATDGYAPWGGGKGSCSGDSEEYLGGKKKGKKPHKGEISSLFMVQSKAQLHRSKPQGRSKKDSSKP